MQGPRVRAADFPAFDGHAAVLWIDAEAHEFGVAFAEQKGRTNLQLLNLRQFAGVRGQGSGQCEFSKPCSWKHDGIPDHMVGQRRMELCIQLVFPGECMLLERVTQQGVDFAPFEEPQGLRRNRVPVALTLPWVVWQLDKAARLGEQLQPVDIHARNHRLVACPPDSLGCIVAAGHGSDDPALCFQVFQAVIEVAAQNGMRADFDKDVDAVTQHVLDGLLEQDGLANVVPPVLRVQFCAAE